MNVATTESTSDMEAGDFTSLSLASLISGTSGSDWENQKSQTSLSLLLQNPTMRHVDRSSGWPLFNTKEDHSA
jgi:hypothetical protein